MSSARHDISFCISHNLPEVRIQLRLRHVCTSTSLSTLHLMKTVQLLKQIQKGMLLS